MALTPRLATAQANRAADAVCVRLNSGYLRLYTDTQPATADTAIGAQTLLAELRWNATAFGAAASGVATANAITGATAGATGTATWFRALESDGTTPVFDGSVGSSGANLNLNSVAISSGAAVSVSAYTYTQATT